MDCLMKYLHKKKRTNQIRSMGLGIHCWPACLPVYLSLWEIFIFVNCNWVAIWWRHYSTHLHINSTQNNTNNTQNNIIHQLVRVCNIPHLCEVYPGICLITEEKAWKNLSQGTWRMPVEKFCNTDKIQDTGPFCLKKNVIMLSFPKCGIIHTSIISWCEFL